MLPMLRHRRCGAPFHRHLRAGQYRPPQCAAGAVAGRDCGAVLRRRPGFARGARRALCAALMLAVGMETLPYVAVAGLYVAARLLDRRPRAGGAGRPASAPPSRPPQRSPSSPQFRPAPGCRPSAMPTPFRNSRSQRSPAPASRSAAGLEPLRRHLCDAACSHSPPSASRPPRPSLLFFPQCLAAPYAMLDPRLKTFFLSAIIEAQPIWSMLRYNPAMAVSYYATPVLGVVLLVWKLRRGGLARCRQSSSWHFLPRRLPSASGRCAARCSRYRWPPSRWPPGSASGGRGSRAGGGSPATLKMALAWLVSLNVAWSASANASRRRGRRAALARRRDISRHLRPRRRLRGAGCAAGDHRACDLQSRLADPQPYAPSRAGRALPPQRRRRCAGTAGLHGKRGARPPRSSRSNGVGLVVLCRGNDETAALSQWAPAGFIAALCRGAVPAWLERMPARRQREPLEIYRIRKQP